jgi:hypothetical protein
LALFHLQDFLFNETGGNPNFAAGILRATDIYPVHPAYMIRIHAMLSALCALRYFVTANFFIDDTCQ